MRTITDGCRKGNRCGRWRDCDECAAIRQAKIADAAEQVLSGAKHPHLVIIKPADRAGLTLLDGMHSAIRENSLARGIWTIEYGSKAGTLHLNMITDAPARVVDHAFTVWSEPVRASIRAAAAYISKRDQMPPKDIYGGRIYGRWGKLADALLKPDMPAIPHAAAIEMDLQRAAGLREVYSFWTDPRKSHDLTSEQYADLARKHLPLLHAIVDQQKRSIKRSK